MGILGKLGELGDLPQKLVSKFDTTWMFILTYMYQSNVRYSSCLSNNTEWEGVYSCYLI